MGKTTSKSKEKETHQDDWEQFLKDYVDDIRGDDIDTAYTIAGELYCEGYGQGERQMLKKIEAQIGKEKLSELLSKQQ